MTQWDGSNTRIEALQGPTRLLEWTCCVAGLTFLRFRNWWTPTKARLPLDIQTWYLVLSTPISYLVRIQACIRLQGTSSLNYSLHSHAILLPATRHLPTNEDRGTTERNFEEQARLHHRFKQCGTHSHSCKHTCMHFSTYVSGHVLSKYPIQQDYVLWRSYSRRRVLELHCVRRQDSSKCSVNHEARLHTITTAAQAWHSESQGINEC